MTAGSGPFPQTVPNGMAGGAQLSQLHHVYDRRLGLSVVTRIKFIHHAFRIEAAPL